MEHLMRLNLGCGGKKFPGWINVDKLPICKPDQVVDLERFPWPWPDNSVDEVRMYYVLEHLGAEASVYLGIIKELHRVCRDNAKIHIVALHQRHDDFLSDPTCVRPVTEGSIILLSQAANRERLAKGVATTPLGFHLEVDFAIESSSQVLADPWDTAFAHKAISDPDLQNAIRSFNNVVRHIDLVVRVIKPAGRAISPGSETMNVTDPPLVPDDDPLGRMRRPTDSSQRPKRILVRRTGAFGDVVSITPITRRLRQERGPDAIIDVDTEYPEIFEGNADVTAAADWRKSRQGLADEGYDEIYDLNGSYERRRRADHGIDCYMEDVFGDRNGDKSLKVVCSSLPDWLNQDPEWQTIAENRHVTIHPAVSWQNRTMPKAFWQAAADHMTAAGYRVVTVGTLRDTQLERVYDLRGKLHPRQQAEVCNRSRVFIGSDCGGLFLAGATDVPIVALFTTSPASMNIIWRHGEPNWRCKPFVPDLACVGCTTRFAEKAWPKLVTYHGCERGDFACVNSFDPYDIAVQAMQLADEVESDARETVLA
jgi:ADP-heptose:LPS heptosyltransferase